MHIHQAGKCVDGCSGWQQAQNKSVENDVMYFILKKLDSNGWSSCSMSIQSQSGNPVEYQLVKFDHQESPKSSWPGGQKSPNYLHLETIRFQPQPQADIDKNFAPSRKYAVVEVLLLPCEFMNTIWWIS